MAVTGLIGKKAGMTQIFNENGDEIPVTVLEVGPCPVVQLKTKENDGYEAVQIAFEPVERKDKRKLPKPEVGHFEKNSVGYHRHLREVRAEGTSEEPLKAGDVLKVDEFEGVDYVSVTGYSKGRGFAGVVKRHGFAGAPMSHGSAEQFRHPGSVGNAEFPGRIFPGRKLPGQYGNEKVKVLNLEVVKIYPEKNILLVKGGVPGPDGSLLIIEKSGRKIKRAPQEAPKKAKKK